MLLVPIHQNCGRKCKGIIFLGKNDAICWKNECPQLFISESGNYCFNYVMGCFEMRSCIWFQKSLCLDNLLFFEFARSTLHKVVRMLEN